LRRMLDAPPARDVADLPKRRADATGQSGSLSPHRIGSSHETAYSLGSARHDLGSFRPPSIRRTEMNDPATSAVVSKDGTTIAFDRYGDGAPIVLVGGAFQYRAFDPPTVELAKLLSAEFSVLHYDRRGRGDSGDTEPYAAQREIDDLHALITEAGGSAFVFGNSSGGPLALDAAAAGLAIDKLVLYEAPFVVDDSRAPVPSDYLDRLRALLSEGRRGDMVELFMATVIGLPDEMVAGMRQSPMWPGFEAVAHTLIYDGVVMEGTQTGKPLPAGRWASVSAPTLVLDGGASDAWMHAAADALADALPNARRHTLEGQTHAVEPAVLAPMVREFLS
jgi:pimeloyl-ACP methyl ester carboxylesterase